MSARRISLSDLADRQLVTDAPENNASEISSSSTEGENASAPPGSVAANVARQAAPRPGIPPAPTPLRPDQPTRVRPAQQPIVDSPRMRYDEYERKETRLRDDQYGRLTAASRRLNKHRKGRGERITENTLIRVAIDLLLDREDQIQGMSEAELRNSVGL